ncbi:MAG: ATP-binding protein [Gammaproteobacteria bacterium]
MNARIDIAPSKPKPAVTEADVALTPAQRTAFDKVEKLLAVSPIVALAGPNGFGRTTILEALAKKHSGKLVSARDLVPVTVSRGPDVSEAAIGELILGLLERTETLLIDNFTALEFNTGTRGLYFKLVVEKTIYKTVVAAGKRLIVAGPPPSKHMSAAHIYGNEAAAAIIQGFLPADYFAFAESVMGKEKAAGIDFKLVYRFASMLTGHQLRMACGLMAKEKAPTAEMFIDCLQRHGIVSANTRIEQVEALSFDSLPGAEEIGRKLETHIVLPLENRVLAQKLSLKPKRGVLLYGPPGTGKTSIGRALAHRMKGKFFLIDGSFVSEPPVSFFPKLEKVVQEAKENSPSVLFIDDADVLFKIEHIAGLARYLLTLLDGLESETASNVCVMMTAMDVRKMPEALLRSGRVELWLETKLPTEEIRGRILERWMGTDLPGYEAVDYKGLAKATEGFTPADLRRIASDAKALFAADTVNKRTIRAGTDYVKSAVDNIMATRSRMANSLGDESLRVGEDRKKSKYGMGAGGMAQISVCGISKDW